jgi:hypothetical protein
MQKFIGLELAGSLHEPDDADPNKTTRYVYQRVAKMFGNIPTHHAYGLQRKVFKKPRNTITPALAARRQLMREAVAAWALTTPEQRDIWRVAGQARRLPARSAFLSSYLSRAVTPETIWDNGETTWDAGATHYDQP